MLNLRSLFWGLHLHMSFRALALLELYAKSAEGGKFLHPILSLPSYKLLEKTISLILANRAKSEGVFHRSVPYLMTEIILSIDMKDKKGKCKENLPFEKHLYLNQLPLVIIATWRASQLRLRHIARKASDVDPHRGHTLSSSWGLFRFWITNREKQKNNFDNVNLKIWTWKPSWT